jgi:hypothetical protein
LLCRAKANHIIPLFHLPKLVVRGDGGEGLKAQLGTLAGEKEALVKEREAFNREKVGCQCYHLRGI